MIVNHGTILSTKNSPKESQIFGGGSSLKLHFTNTSLFHWLR